MAGLALPSAAASAANSPAKDKKRKRAKPKKDDDDSDAELEISAEDLVAADGDGETRAAEGGEDDDEEEAAQTGAAVARHVKREAQRRREQTLLLRGVLDEEQGKRFDAFRSVVIPRQVVKKLNKDLYDQNVPNNLTSVVAGMVKVFVADVVETAGPSQAAGARHDGCPVGFSWWEHEQLDRSASPQASVPQVRSRTVASARLRREAEEMAQAPRVEVFDS
ncbi:uncharacterized protein EHS24_002828 [Apiotrichum porosum]|uniref:TAFII28-like protein domain-containing protein n=1 Tax=Apiotrichum porosum TaxID=105984 RepID=A0A427XFU1_9TREE|nr:uncharacterized protein EHS24_002828 [Apiotrichum porosum]RSH77769.1 hypothetical protein EHS24_002828 [Apiotrichum porosum]